MNKAFEIALKEYGQKEIVGSTNSPRVLEYFKTVGHSWVKDDETAWCAAFVGFCLEKAGMKSTRLLNARSYLNWGIETSTPELGDLVVFWRGTKLGSEGHIAFYINETADYIRVLGGNQSNQVCIAEYPKNQLLSYRKIANPTSSKSDEQIKKIKDILNA